MRRSSTIGALVALLCMAAPGHGQTPAEPTAEAASMAWPTEGWRVRPLDEATRTRPAFLALENYLFPPGFDEQTRAGVRTDGIVVIQDDALVYERYGRGYTAEMAHPAWSVTKVLVDALYGVAVQQGLVSIDDPVAAHSDVLAADGRAAITFRQLLEMSSGLGFREAYEWAPLRSSVIAMLYTRGRGDMARFAAGHPLAQPPGSSWAYASGDSVLLMAALRDVVGEERYADWPWTALFDVIGMASATFERDGAGTFVGSSYLFASPRDLAKLGFLYLQDGRWQDRQLLPQGWAARAGEPGPATFYGRHWWTNRGDAGERPWPDAPADTIAGSGHWGQKLFVVPSRDLVVVRAGDDRDHSFDTDTFLRLALEAFSSGGP
jgi:CubicO group peptidase (beta-lactamase class C family)